MIFDTIVWSGLKSSAITLAVISYTAIQTNLSHTNHNNFNVLRTKKERERDTHTKEVLFFVFLFFCMCVFTLSVTIPESKALESVNRTASTRRAAIRRQASQTVVPSGIVRAFDNLNFFTVLSPEPDLHKNLPPNSTTTPNEKKKATNFIFYFY